MCKYLKVSSNSYYHWLKTKDNYNKHLVHLKHRITRLFYENQEIYGSTRIKKMLEREGLNYSISYIGHLMNQLGLKSILKKKFVVTTDSKHDDPIAGNILNREFNTTEIGKKWVSDITYIQVDKHWNYLTTIIDLADRKLVGWSLSDDMTTENTVYKAWLNARNTRE